MTSWWKGDRRWPLLGVLRNSREVRIGAPRGINFFFQLPLLGQIVARTTLGAQESRFCTFPLQLMLRGRTLEDFMEGETVPVRTCDDCDHHHHHLLIVEGLASYAARSLFYNW